MFFTPVCYSVYLGGGGSMHGRRRAWQGTYVVEVGGMHGKGDVHGGGGGMCGGDGGQPCRRDGH